LGELSPPQPPRGDGTSQGGISTRLPPVSYVTSYDILFLHTVSCPYSTATRHKMVASLSLWRACELSN